MSRVADGAARCRFPCAPGRVRTHMVFGRIALRQEPTATPTLDSPCSSAEAPPSWLVSLRESVPPTTYKKGRAYASSGRVSLLTTAADGLEARVQGSLGEQYEVRLRIDRGEVESRCSCPAWNQYGPHCKHVVAAALALCGQRESSPAQGGGFDSPCCGPTVSLASFLEISVWIP